MIKYTNKKWCMCTELEGVSGERIGIGYLATCDKCGGDDPFGIHPKRFGEHAKAVTKSLDKHGIPQHIRIYLDHISAARMDRDNYKKIADNQRDNRFIWEGKFHQVKRENNKLRKKVADLNMQLNGIIDEIKRGDHNNKEANTGVVEALKALVVLVEGNGDDRVTRACCDARRAIDNAK
jgi:hypothetical protein